MSFCKYSTQSIINNKTEIDNIFINDFLPYAPGNAVKVYLYGLYKCNSPSSYDNSIESFSKVLKLSEEEILEIYEFWENEGLVQILKTVPIEIRYMPLKNIVNNLKNYNVSKYGNFSAKAQEIIEGRMIGPVEFKEYFDIIEIFHIEPEAMLMIMKYCVNTKGGNVGYPYILAVAKNWAYENIKTVSDVEERLISYERNSDDLKIVFKNLSIKRTPTIEEKELYLKWTKELGFELGFILEAIKLNKKPSSKITFQKLDEILLAYYEMKLSTFKEIEDFELNKTNMIKFAKQIAKELGLYYENVEKLVETYISKWLSMGFSEEAIVRIANYCFKCSIRKFEGMNNIIQKFYKLGLLSVDSLQKYFDEIILEDNKIKELIALTGLDRPVNSMDRTFYSNWKNNWKVPDEIIEYGASFAAEKAQPMKYLNGILAKWNELGVKTLEDAKKNSFSFEASKKTNSVPSRTYSKENLNALFDSLEEVEI